jgi:DNA-binding transcriptional ArsR family regulator
MEVFMKNGDRSGDVSDVCSANIIHEDILERVRQEMLPGSLLSDMAEFYKVMGDTTRVSILHALSFSELCVCDISALLGMSQSAVSHQLKTLRQMRLVTSRRDGKVVYYSLNDEHIQQMIELGRTHLTE